LADCEEASQSPELAIAAVTTGRNFEGVDDEMLRAVYRQQLLNSEMSVVILGITTFGTMKLDKMTLG